MDCILFIHWPVDEHFGCLLVLVTANSVAMKYWGVCIFPNNSLSGPRFIISVHRMTRWHEVPPKSEENLSLIYFRHHSCYVLGFKLSLGKPDCYRYLY